MEAPIVSASRKKDCLAENEPFTASYAEIITALCRDAWGTLHWEYSGRFMYGDTCLALSVEDLDGLDDLKYEARHRGLPRPQEDRLGRGYILYWPGVKKKTEAEVMR